MFPGTECRMRPMASLGMNKSMSALSRGAVRTLVRVSAIVFFSLLFSVAGCERMTPLDTKPLDSAGMSYPAIKQLIAMDITLAELAEVAKARAAGFPDDDCIEVVRIYHVRNRPFTEGDTVAGLVQSHLRADTILDLASLDQLGVNAGELRLMRLAGLSDSIVLEAA